MKGSSVAEQLENFIHGVERRNPGETEFHQAVEEVAATVIPFIQDKPIYQEMQILERMAEPDRIISFRVCWENDDNQIRTQRGYRIQNNNAIGPYKWLPWPATIVVFSAMAHAAAGWRLAAFTVVSLLYMVVVGYWDESMNTLALVGVSVPLAVGAGFLIGIWGFKSRAARRIIEPTLDVMQTVPTFAYLIPILLLFGFGPVVGLVASVICRCKRNCCNSSTDIS